MRFDLVTHDPDALFNIIAKQQRDQNVIETNGAERQRREKRRDDKSMTAAVAKPQGYAADEHRSRASAKLLEQHQSGTIGTTTKSAVWQARSRAAGLPPKPARESEESRPWPEPRPDPHTAAAFHKRSRSAYPGRNNRDVPCACHPSS